MRRCKSFLVSILATSLLALPIQTGAKPNQSNESAPAISHVLLISVDGFHALDLTNYVDSHPDSTLASLSRHGITYTNNYSSQPSDSFPGAVALLTGASQIDGGFWYDDTYNRSLSPPVMTDGLGDPGGPCPGQIGTIVALDESIDINLQDLDGGGGLNVNYMVRDPNNNCAVLFPHQLLRVNTIFEVVKAHNGRTAWTDKHPSYEWVNGPSGTGVDDFYGPEVNSDTQPLPFPGCTPEPYVDHVYDDGWTNSFGDIQCYDQLHIQAVLNQIDGWNHNHTQQVGVPTVFGTNFQSVSVGEKVKVDPANGLTGGYFNVIGVPNPGLAGQLDFVDASLGRFVAELKSQGLFDSTLIIIGAKHGQSPIDITKNHNIGNGQPTTAINTAFPGADVYDSSDDGSLIWLANSQLTGPVVEFLSNPNTQALLGIQEIFAGNSLANKFNTPGTGPGQDPRTPDIVLKVNTGVIFTGNSNKIAEHGGLNEDDNHTALLVSFPTFSPAHVKTPTTNQQVAASILQALGIDPGELQAVKNEQIQVLPFLFTNGPLQ